jgi:tetratricopeptide (TPR) repeat protein
MENEDSKEFEQILKTYEDSKKEGKTCYLDSESFSDISEYYFRKGKIQEALETAEAGLDIHPDNAYLRIAKINALICMDHFEEARDLLVGLDPDEEFDVYFFEGELAIALDNDFERADEYFKLWIDADLDTLDLSVEDDKNRFKDDLVHVMDIFSDLKKDDDDVSPFIRKWVDVYIEKCGPLTGDDYDTDVSSICHDENMISEEINLFTLFLDNNPYMKDGWSYLASLYNVLDNPEEALNAVEFALAISPDDVNAWGTKSLSYRLLNNYVEAEKALRKYLELGGDKRHNVDLAECLMYQDKTEEARKYLDIAEKFADEVQDKEDQAKIRMLISTVYFECNMQVDAMRMIIQSLEYDDKSVDFIMLKAAILLHMGGSAYAFDAFNDAIKLSGRSLPVIMRAGLEFYDVGQKEAAAYFFKKVVRARRKDPCQIHAYVYLAVCCLRLQRFDEFLLYLRHACKLVPEEVRQVWPDLLKDVDPSDYFKVLKQALEREISK